MLLLIYINQYFAHSTKPAKGSIKSIYIQWVLSGCHCISTGGWPVLCQIMAATWDSSVLSHTLPNFCNLADSYGSWPKITKSCHLVLIIKYLLQYLLLRQGNYICFWVYLHNTMCFSIYGTDNLHEMHCAGLKMKFLVCATPTFIAKWLISAWTQKQNVGLLASWKNG